MDVGMFPGPCLLVVLHCQCGRQRRAGGLRPEPLLEGGRCHPGDEELKGTIRASSLCHGCASSHKRACQEMCKTPSPQRYHEAVLSRFVRFCCAASCASMPLFPCGGVELHMQGLKHMPSSLEPRMQQTITAGARIQR